MNLEFKWKFIYTRRAAEDFRNLSKNTQKRISEKMRFFSEIKDISKFAKSLEDKKLGSFRFRVGDYRIIFEKVENKKEIYILRVGKRDEIYK